MIIMTIPKEDMEHLQYERYNHPHPRVQQKMEALLLKAYGLPHNKIGDILGITQNTLRSYFNTYKEGGIEALQSFCPRTKTGELDLYTTTLVEEFKKNPPLTLREAADRIEQLTGVKRSTTAISKYFKKTVLNG